MKTLLVVCARKGSKRLKDKHLLLINGKELWTYAGYAAMKLQMFLRLDTSMVVSSDDPHIIATVSKAVGRYSFQQTRMASISRPRSLSGDRSPIHLVLQHALNSVDAAKAFDAVAFIPANVPTITPELISDCVEKLRRSPKLDSVITVREMRDRPEWAFAAGKAGVLERVHEIESYRMQQLPKRYVPTGTVNVVRTKTLMACQSAEAFKYLGKRIGFVLDPDAIEIHDQRDLELARAWLGRKA